MKTPISALLRGKSDRNEVYSIAPAAIVFEAVQLMSKQHVGALLVLNGNGKIAGIISERDCFKKVLLEEKSPRKVFVKDVMTKAAKMIMVSPERTVEECMELMTERHVRHLPVTDGDKVLGVVSMRDVVAFLASEQDILIQNLEKYIAGSM